MAIDANARGFTVKALSQCDTYIPDGEYNVRIVRSVYSPVELTFLRNISGEYELASYLEPGIGEKWDCAENPPFKVESLKITTYNDAMDHFFGAYPWNSAHQTGD